MTDSIELSVEWPDRFDDRPDPSSGWDEIKNRLERSEVPGSEFLGWRDWPNTVDDDLLDRVEEVAEEIRQRADVFVVAGIGGSYLGARAVIEALGDPSGGPDIRYAGNQLSGPYHRRLLDDLKQRSVYVNVVSKSGTTTETALAFRFLRDHVETRYGGEEVSRRIIATTDAEEGALVDAANEEGYRRFVIPDEVGGRFSVFTAVGLLPIAVAGIDIRELLDGAAVMREQILTNDRSIARRYASVRQFLYDRGVTQELFASFYPELSYVGKWWQQLFGESEGKQGQGIYPSTVDFTTDLHSMGQYIQEGPRTLFETLPVVQQRPSQPIVPEDEDDLDGLNYLAGRSLEAINREALEGTVEAHVDGGVPVVRLSLPFLAPGYLGRLLYFYMYACALSALKLGVNPFNQPGVEAYKDNMYRRLGRPGHK